MNTDYENLEFRKDDFDIVGEHDNESRVFNKPSLTYWQDAWIRLKKNKVAIASLIILLLIILMTIIGPLLTPWIFSEMGDIAMKNQTPSSEHWFGTDHMGRDVFTRVWVGGRISIVVAIVGAFLDITLGLTYGSIAAFFGGKIDNIMMRITEVLISIPYLMVVILVSLIVGKGVFSLIIAMTLTGWCYMARLVRGQILQIKEQEFVLAAKALGTNPIKIIIKHLLPNILGVMIVAVTFDIPSFIFGEAFLSYIGLGIQSPNASWGSLAASAQQNMIFYPHQLFFPALMISLTILSFHLLGDGLRDALDPKLRK